MTPKMTFFVFFLQLYREEIIRGELDPPVDLRDLADGDFSIDSLTELTIDGQQFEFIDFEILLLNDASNLLLNPNGPTGWTIDGGAGTDTLDYSAFVSVAGVTVDFQAGTETNFCNRAPGFNAAQIFFKILRTPFP